MCLVRKRSQTGRTEPRAWPPQAYGQQQEHRRPRKGVEEVLRRLLGQVTGKELPGESCAVCLLHFEDIDEVAKLPCRPCRRGVDWDLACSKEK